MENKTAHWEQIYSENNPDEVSWFQTRPSISLEFIGDTKIDKTERIIDVGGGASTLVDYLLDSGYKNVSVLDISSSALERAKKRLADRASSVQWIVSDIKDFRPKQQFNLWHDRAVFHFLTSEQDRADYLRVLRATLKKDGHYIISTFAIDGPQKCSGLNIVQYSSESLAKVFGEDFELKETKSEIHQTPWNSDQKFIYCRFQFRGK